MKAQRDARRFAWIALEVLILSEVVASVLFALEHRVYWLQQIPAVPLTTMVFFWIAPFLIACRIERRGLQSLGLASSRKGYVSYALFAALVLGLPAILVGIDRTLLVEFIEQLVYIGVAEEFFHRGYVMTRLCNWLGERKGLLFNALLFALSHVASRVGQHGLNYAQRTAVVGAQALCGGLLFGYLYLKTKSIVPGAIIHVAGNAFLG